MRENQHTINSCLLFFLLILQWSEHPSPFWTFHAAVPLVKAASSRNYMGTYMFFSGCAKHPNYLFQWMKPLLKVMMFLHQIDKVWHQFFGRTRQNCLTPHPLLDHWLHTLAHFCDGHLSFRMSAIFKVQCKRRVDSVAASPREYLVRRPAKNVISPPRTPPKKKQPPKKQQCKIVQRARASRAAHTKNSTPTRPSISRGPNYKYSYNYNYTTLH